MCSRRASGVTVRIDCNRNIAHSSQSDFPRSRRVSIIVDDVPILSVNKHNSCPTPSNLICSTSSSKRSCTSSNNSGANSYQEKKVLGTSSFPQIPAFRKVGTVLWKKSVSETHFTIGRKYVFCKENDPHSTEGCKDQYFIFLKNNVMLPVEKRRIEFFNGGEEEETLMKQEMLRWPRIAPLKDLAKQQDEMEENQTTHSQKAIGCEEEQMEAMGDDLTQEKEKEKAEKIVEASSPILADHLSPSLPPDINGAEVEVVPEPERLMSSTGPSSPSPPFTVNSGHPLDSSKNYSAVFPRLRMLPTAVSHSLHSCVSTPHRVMKIGTILVEISKEDAPSYADRIDCDRHVEFDVFGQEMLGIRPYYVNYKGDKIMVQDRRQIKFDRLAAYPKQRRRSSSVDRSRRTPSILSPHLSK